MTLAEPRFPVQVIRGVPVVVAPQEVDITNADRLRAALLRAAARPGADPRGRHGRDPVLRLRRLHALHGAHKRAQAEGRQVRLVITGAQVRRILALTALDRLIAVYTSLDQALARPPATGHTKPVRMIRESSQTLRVGGSGVDLADGFQDERGGAVDGAADQVAGAVAVVDLGQAAVHLDGVAVGAGGHVAEGQRVGKLFAILAYSALFLAEDAGILRLLAEKGRAGVTVRIALGDPDGANVAERGEEEGIGGAMAAKIRNALALYSPLCAVENIEIRLHRTVLYNSIYRADDRLLIAT